MIRLRDYQLEAIEAVRAQWAGGKRRVGVSLPTGSGKTVVFTDPRLRAGIEGRPLVLVHREELAQQAVAKARAANPTLRVGIVKAGMDQVGADFIVGSVPTLRGQARRERLRNIGLVIVDEAHHAPAESYRTILDWYGCYGPTGVAEHRTALAVGFTATMSRGDGVGLGGVWESIAYERDIRWMITRGYLVAPTGLRVSVGDLDLRGVSRRGGDYVDSELGAALEDSAAPECTVKAWTEHAAGRSTILFAPTVAYAQLMAERFTEAGVSAAAVWGAMPAEERRLTLKRFEAGEVQVLCNCMVLTEGTDLPVCSCIVVARPTSHVGLYTQMVGRGLRLAPGKSDCLVLDVVGATRRHALMSVTDLLGERDEVAGRAEAVEVDAEEVEEFTGPGWAVTREESWAGPMVVESVDLFHGSRAAWLRTRAGTWFTPAGKDRFLVLVREGEAWGVVSADRYRVGASRWVVRGVEDKGYAMAHAEGDITEAEQHIAARAAGWRKRAASQAQADYARRLGAMVGEGMRSGEVSNLITVAEATARIDRWMPAALRY